MLKWLKAAVCRLFNRRPWCETKRSPRWASCRLRHLQREPACQWCGGKASLEVHHIYPFHQFPERELDPANLITLCECKGLNCHLQHGHKGNWSDYDPGIRRKCEEHRGDGVRAW